MAGHTFPRGNLARNSVVLFVFPSSNSGGSDTTFRPAPLYWAAISTLYARKLSGYVYNVCVYKEMGHNTCTHTHTTHKHQSTTLGVCITTPLERCMLRLPQVHMSITSLPPYNSMRCKRITYSCHLLSTALYKPRMGNTCFLSTHARDCIRTLNFAYN